MSKWARIENNMVAETTDIDPAGRFHPSLIWVSCPEDIVGGCGFDGSNFLPPPARYVTTAQDLAPGRNLDGLSADEVAALESLAELINTNPDALRQATEV